MWSRREGIGGGGPSLEAKRGVQDRRVYWRGGPGHAQGAPLPKISSSWLLHHQGSSRGSWNPGGPRALLPVMSPDLGLCARRGLSEREGTASGHLGTNRSSHRSQNQPQPQGWKGSSPASASTPYTDKETEAQQEGGCELLRGRGQSPTPELPPCPGHSPASLSPALTHPHKLH